MRSRNHSRPRGLTLVEVLASLVLLGGLVGSVVLTKAQLSRQWSAATQRQVAAERLDALLEAWHRGDGVPVDAEGPLPLKVDRSIEDGFESALRTDHESDGLWWRTYRLPREGWDTFGVEALVVEVWDEDRSPTSEAGTAQRLFAVEVFRYAPSPERELRSGSSDGTLRSNALQSSREQSEGDR